MFKGGYPAQPCFSWGGISTANLRRKTTKLGGRTQLKALDVSFNKANRSIREMETSSSFSHRRRECRHSEKKTTLILMHRLATSQDWVTPSHQASSSKLFRYAARCWFQIVPRANRHKVFRLQLRFLTPRPPRRLWNRRSWLINRLHQSGGVTSWDTASLGEEGESAGESCLTMHRWPRLTDLPHLLQILQDILIYLSCFKSHNKESRYPFIEKNLFRADFLSETKIHKTLDLL